MTDFEKTFGPLAATLSELIMNSIDASTGTNVLISREELKKLQDAVRDKDERIRELTKQRDTAIAQRDANTSSYHTTKVSLDAAERRIQELERNVRTLEHRRREAEKLASSVQGMIAHPDPRYNKLVKDHTAACNQRDSFKRTVAAQNITIRSLESDLKAAREAVPNTVTTIYVNGVPYTADDILKIRDESNSRATEIERLSKLITEGAGAIRVGAFCYSASDIRSLLNTIDQLRRNNTQLREAKPTMLIKGKYMTVKQVEDALDRNLKYAAEIDRLNALLKRANSTLRGTITSVRRERTKRKELMDELKAARASAQQLQDQAEANRTAPAKIDVPGHVAHIRVLQPEAASIEIAGVIVPALIIPQMAGDLVAKSKEVEGLQQILKERDNTITNKNTIISCKDSEIAELKRRNENQRYTIEQQDHTIRDLRATKNSQAKLISEKDTQLNTLNIENRLLKGRLNARQPVTHVETVVKSGQSYMTTDIGLLPINDTGMRTLADAYHALSNKVSALSGYLESWVKE